MPSTGVLVILAIIPAVIIIAFIYYKDKAEKEPIGLLIGLFIMGATISVIGAVLAEYTLGKVLDEVADKGSTAYNFIMCFFIIALSEEGFKFLVLRLRTWKHKAFNYTFDAVVYAVVVSLGFATLENILYVVDEGTYNIALWRGILSVPGHAIDAVFMGLFYGKAKYCQCCGDSSGKSKNMFLSLFVPILTHGFYDFCLYMSGTNNSKDMMVLFFGFEIVITITALVIIHKTSKGDKAIPGMGVPFWQFPAYPYNYYNYNQQPYQQSYQQTYQPQYDQTYQQNQYQQYGQYGQINYQQTQYGQTLYQQYGQTQYQQYGQQQGYYTPNGYTQPNTSYQDQYYGQNYQQPYQNYQQQDYAQQGQYYGQNGYSQQYQNTNYQYNYNGNNGQQ